MSIILREKITDNVCGAVWLATLILTYKEMAIKNSNKIFFKQATIQKMAQILCPKIVHSPRIQQWCNGDHKNNLYNYLRADGSKRRLTRIGEFNHSKEYPEHLLNSDEVVFEFQDGRKMTYEELFGWYCKTYSNTNISSDPYKDDSSIIEYGSQNDSPTKELQEDDIKRIIANYLNENGWNIQLAMGKNHGIDIDACKEENRWIIEVKGCGSRNAMRVNYFLAILGEILQRMNDPKAKYSIALPDMKQYRNLWDKLPRLAKERTGITALFINENEQIEEVV